MVCERAGKNLATGVPGAATAQGTAILRTASTDYVAYAHGKVKLHIKPTRYAANIAGGLLFGVGFGVMGYCPGTGSAALGQGNFDALVGIAGLMAGSYFYAELSSKLEKTILKWGDRGKVTFPELFRVSRLRFMMVFVPVLAFVRVALYWNQK
ncbi:MAG: YeeE/YedE thiosulfate transporter family protein [Phycisphaerae bacterium]